jgi:hypothetical protein
MFAITKRWNALAVTMSLVATFAAGCSGSAKTSDAVSKGDVRVAVSGMSSLQTDVVTMTLTVGQGTGTPTFPNIVLPMSKNSNGEWTGYATGIPAGTGRTFHVEAKDAAAVIAYVGDGTANITAGGTALVYMMLQQPTPANNFNNHAPVIDTLTSTAGTVLPGATVNLTVTAHDPDTATDAANHISGFLWTATCGTLTGANTATPSWQAPVGADTTCTLSVTVADVCPSTQPAICASSVTASLVIQVTTPQSGNAQVNAYPNTCPAISCVYSNQTFTYDAQGKVNGYQADITVNAMDAEGDDLHYVWSSTGCPGAVFSPTGTPAGTNPTGEITTAPTTVHLTANTVNACDIRVDVKDYWPGNTPPAGSGLLPARGCTNVGHLYLGGATNFAVAPVIQNLIKPNAGNQVAAGQSYTFGASTISDPQNAYPLQISWYDGNLSPPGVANPSGTFISQVPAAPYQLAAPGQATMVWRAPAVLVPGMKITLRVTNALGLFTEQVYNIVPANACALAANGTACDDGNACTQTDTCQNGACVGSNPVVCPTLACNANTCNPGTGTCSATPVAAGTTCSDGNACTANDQCNAVGVCTSGPAVVCPGIDQCHSAACIPATGCAAPVVTVGVACNDANACTTGETCQASGTCGGGAPTVCVAQDQCHDVGVCNVASGGCSNPAKANGAVCNDGLACTTSDVCTAGVCGGTAVTCAAPNVCSETTTPAGQCAPPGPPSALVATQEGGALGGVPGLAVDELGYVYQAGNMFQPGFDFGCGLINSAGSSDAFVVKLDPSTGRCVAGLPAAPTGWSKDFGDATNDQSANGVAVNLTTVGLAGRFGGLMSIPTATPTPISLNNAGIAIDYVAGLDRGTGLGAWIKGFDLNDPTGAPAGQISSIASTLVAGATNNHFAVCGYVSGKVANTTTAGLAIPLVTDLAAVAGGGLDIVVAVIDGASGSVIWGKQFGGLGDQTCNAVAFDDAGNVVITGAHKGTLTFPPLAALTNPTGSNSWTYVAKLDGLTGAPIAAATFGGSTTTSRQTARAIATDAGGNIAVTGQFQGTALFGATPALAATGTSLDVFTVKFNSSLVPVWSNRLGGTAADDSRAVAIDSIGQVWVTGVFDQTTTGVAALTTFGGTDTFILRLDPSTGNASYAANFGDALGQEGLTLVAARFASGAQKDAIWTKGNFAGSITFPGQPAIVGTATETRKYVVKLK